jgi:ATP-dependent DNA helicase RecG
MDEGMDRSERVNACFWHCVLRYINNKRMTNASLRDRFKLDESKSESVSKVIRQAMDGGKIRPLDPTRSSKKFASYIPWWA